MTRSTVGRGSPTADVVRASGRTLVARTVTANGPGAPRGDGGVVALELALTLPLVALLLVGAFGLVGVVRASLLTQEAARLGARVAAVNGDDAAVRRAVVDVLGPDADATVGPRRVREVVEVTVTVPVDVVGMPRTVTARSAALVEPVVD